MEADSSDLREGVGDRLSGSGDGRQLIDPFGRHITYLRLSVTDRCDLRCVYCMSEHMTFLPKAELLTLEELDRLTSAFITRGVRKVRLTGGEPLVRRDVTRLIRSLSRHLATGALDELTVTTNGSQLERFADDLADCGVRRINVSIDSLDADRFRAVTRGGDLAQILRGIVAAERVGISVKINTVALRDQNEDEIPNLVEWAHSNGRDITLIETMPLGAIEEDRTQQYLPLSIVRERLGRVWTLENSDHRTGGPARYATVAETGGRIGFITPLSHNFCESCNRIRVTCTGTLFMCLGQGDDADLRSPLRRSEADAGLHEVIDEAIRRKPKGHDFVIERRGVEPALARHMSVTGG